MPETTAVRDMFKFGKGVVTYKPTGMVMHVRGKAGGKYCVMLAPTSCGSVTYWAKPDEVIWPSV